jgi:hypothetical protein
VGRAKRLSRPRDARLLAASGYKTEHVVPAIATKITTLPESLRRSLTWDQGIEMREWKQIPLATGIDVYFCDPHAPWQRASNENTNGLLRHYFPKAPTSASTASSTSTASPTSSTTDPANASGSTSPQNSSQSSCCNSRSNPPNAYRTLRRMRAQAALAGARSVGSVGCRVVRDVEHR